MNANAGTIIYVAGLVIGTIVRGHYSRGYFRGIREDIRSSWVDGVFLSLAGIGMALPILFFATPWLDFAAYRLPPPGRLVTAIIGGAILAATLILLWRAHADIGRNWSLRLETQRDQTLVTSGVYGKIRHPMYAAHLLWGIAQVILIHNWIAGPAFLAGFILLYLYRVPREERMMMERFRNEYQNYMERTGRILPKRRPASEKKNGRDE